MTTIRDEIKKAALVNNPVGVSFKDYKKYMLIIAPNYSSHSAVFDKAFDLARYNGIKYKGVSENPWTIKFY